LAAGLGAMEVCSSTENGCPRCLAFREPAALVRVRLAFEVNHDVRLVVEWERGVDPLGVHGMFGRELFEPCLQLSARPTRCYASLPPSLQQRPNALLKFPLDVENGSVAEAKLLRPRW
jgi:hypothetical protein